MGTLCDGPASAWVEGCIIFPPNSPRWERGVRRGRKRYPVPERPHQGLPGKEWSAVSVREMRPVDARLAEVAAQSATQARRLNAVPSRADAGQPHLTAPPRFIEPQQPRSPRKHQPVTAGCTRSNTMAIAWRRGGPHCPCFSSPKRGLGGTPLQLLTIDVPPCRRIVLVGPAEAAAGCRLARIGLWTIVERAAVGTSVGACVIAVVTASCGRH